MAYIIPRPRYRPQPDYAEALRDLLRRRGPRLNRADEYLGDPESPFVHQAPSPAPRPPLMPDETGLEPGVMVNAPLPASFAGPGAEIAKLLGGYARGRRSPGAPLLGAYPPEPDPLELLRDRLVRWLAARA